MFGEALFGHQIGNDVGRQILTVGADEDFLQIVVDGAEMLIQLQLIEADLLEVDVDNAASIDDVVGRVKDAALFQLQPVPPFGQLIVGGSGDYAGFELWDSRVVENCAHGAGGEDVDLLGENFIGRNGDGAEVADGFFNLFGVGVANQKFGVGV